MTNKKRKGGSASIDPGHAKKAQRKNANSGSDGKTRPHSLDFSQEVKLTKDSFKDECDVNRIVNRYAQTGLITHVQSGEPQYGDAPDQDLFQAACVAAELRSQVEDGLDIAEIEKNALAASEAVSDETPDPEGDEIPPIQGEETAAQDEQSGEGI
ncbi:internal scaffolding protein [Microviridae sp.]|nr:internal scaffolding protein [Microviridae sp.]